MNDRPIRILLIEDNPGDARLLQAVLTEGGFAFDLKQTDRLSTGLEWLETEDFDVVLSDLSLPDSRGFDTFARVYAHAPKVPVIVLSGLDDEGLAVKSVRAGAQDYLVKGQIDGNLLARAIHYAIERKQAEIKLTYYLQTEHLLRQVSSRFVDVQNLDQAIKGTLRDTGTLLHANQAYLFKIHDGGAKMSSTHEWVTRETVSQAKNLQGLDTSSFPWWMERLTENDVIVASDVDQLPQPEREMFEQLGVLSTLAIPIFAHGSLYGFFSFDETEQPREWESDEIGFLRNVAQILGRAIERAEAEQALQRRNLELAALNAVAQALSTSLELQDVLDEALSRTVHALGFTGGLLNLADERTGELKLYSYTGLPLPLLKHLETRGLGGTLCEHVYRKGEPLNIENLGKDAPVDVRGLLKAGFQSYVGTPIVHKERTLGTLCLFDAAPHPVLENDLALLTAIGQQIGVAVENALLFEDVARERKVAQTLLDTAEALSTTLQLDKLLERVLDELQRVVPYDAASISMLHDEQCWIATSRGLTSTSAERFTLEERPLVRQVVHGRDLVIVPDVRHEPAWVAVEGTGDVRSWLGVPLIAKDRVIGVLMVDSHQPDTYDQEAGRLAFAFAHQVALAIDNSRLYEQTRAQLREAVLLHGVTAALSSTLDMEQMLSYVARSLGEGLNSTHVEIYSLDEEANTITVTTDYTAARPTAEKPHSNRGQTYPLADFPIIAEALAWNRPVQAKANNPGATSHEMAHLEARGAQAVLFLPMVAHGHTVGLAAVWEEQGPRRFTEGELAMGQTLTHQGAIALDNVRLFEETQHRVRELQLLHDVGLAAASGAALLDTLLATVNALATEFEGSRVAIALSNQEDHMLQMMVNANFPPEVNDVRIPIGEGISGWVAQHGEPVLVPDVRQDPRYIGIDLDTRSELCVPLSTGSLVIGILNIESPQVNTFTEDDLRLVNTLANNLAMFVERARLFEKVESARIELQQRAEALEEANARLGEANTRLQELDRLKSQFLANMSHELRTPLNSIIGFSEVLVDGLMGELPPDQKECAENILYSGDHLLALINDVLDLSKIEAGRMSLELVTFDVAEWLAEGQATIMALFEKKAQTLTVEMADDLPPLTADRFRVKQVLINLLSNANKFTPDEGRITISCRLADPATMLFSVADTGMGIKAEDQEIIFEEFCQSSDSSRQHIEGTGLGLTISKRLIEMHGGRIWVESEPEHGATFSFLLPLAGPLEPQPETKEAIALSTTGKTVLVVEDDRQFSNLLAFYLRQEGYAPVQHYSGAGVLERVLELKPSLITLDIMLPEQDGWEVLRTLKADPQTRDIPVMVISALESSELALSLGAAEYLDKPMHRSDLQDLLNRLAGPQPSGRKVRILVVDDDPDIIRLLGDMLSTADYTLLSACDGAEGFSLARSERPDAILLNLMMPETNGFDMLEQLRTDTETADIPVIVLTAIDVTTEQRELLQDNIQGLLRKSTLTPHALLEELRRLEELAAP